MMPATDSPSITGILFSKDRALQLDATLRSFFRHCQDPESVSLKVIYKASSSLQLNQYDQLRSEFPEVDFVTQGDFRQDVFGMVGIPLSRWGRRASRTGAANHLADRFVLFLVDDNIFVRDFHLSAASSALAKEEAGLGFALQLGRNIDYCYALDIPLTFPAAISVSGDIVKYRWSDAGSGLNYPLEVSSSLYRLGDIARLLAGLKFTNPNTLEARMAAKAGSFEHSHPYLLCYSQSVTFCNPINKVQGTYDNRAGERPDYSADSLARLFEQGYRVNVAGYDGFVPGSCHQESELVLSKRSSD